MEGKRIFLCPFHIDSFVLKGLEVQLDPAPTASRYLISRLQSLIRFVNFEAEDYFSGDGTK
jgi:hypothetical protein